MAESIWERDQERGWYQMDRTPYSIVRKKKGFVVVDRKLTKGKKPFTPITDVFPTLDAAKAGYIVVARTHPNWESPW
jgi:hypothetical protein